MSLTDELRTSKKLNFHLAAQLHTLAASDPKEQSLSVIFKMSSAPVVRKSSLLDVAGNVMRGVEISNNIGRDLYTAYLSLEGLKALVDDSRVVNIEGRPFKKDGPFKVTCS